MLRVKNGQGTDCVVEVVDHAYGEPFVLRTVGAGKEVSMLLSFGRSQGWYDLSVRVQGVKGFEKRYAGRVETGKDGVSDPQMA